jgi:hypothetical protein
MSKLACAVLGLVAFVALLLVQGNLPWAEETDGDATAHTWGQTESGSNFLFSYSSAKSWYDGGWGDEDQNAVNQLQVATPVLVAGTVLLLVGSLLAFTGEGATGATLTLVGGLGAAAGTLLYFLAFQDLYDNGVTWQAAFYLAFIGSLLGVAGGVVGLVGANTRRAAA